MALGGYLSQIFFKTTNAAPSGTDEPAGIKKINGTPKRDLGDATDFKNNAGAKARIPLLLDAAPTCSGDYLSGDTVQQLVRASLLNGTLLYCTIYADPSAGAGNKGFQFPVYIESVSIDDAVDGVVQTTITTGLSGLPVAI